MKTQKFSILLGSLGIFIVFIFTWKFMINSDFTSMWLVGCGIGSGCLISAYLYSWMREVDKKFQDIEKRIDAFLNWVSKEELK